MNRGSWIGFVSRRWYRSGSAAGPSLAPAAAGIAVGVAALVIVIGVMNGFQMGFVDAVLELDSYHIRVSPSAVREPGGEGEARAEALAARLAELPGVTAALPFADLRTIMTNERGRSEPARIKIVPADAATRDRALASRLSYDGASLDTADGLVIGELLARSLNLVPGDEVSVLEVSADEQAGVGARMVKLKVASVFHSGFYDFDAGLAFLPRQAAGGLGGSEPRIVGLKLRDRYGDAAALAELRRAGVDPGAAESWRQYNRSFFGALRMEKSIMMALVGLIFLVVGVNIFHAMRKAVYARMEEIALLKAVGARSASVRNAFLLNGLAAGAGGAALGLAAGLLLAMNVNAVFDGLEAVLGFVATALRLDGRSFEFFSPDFFYVGDVPVAMPFAEALFIFLAGASSAVAAAWAASERISRFRPSEVLRDE